MYLYELSRRPWEARDEEERKRIEIYEAFCKMAIANKQAHEANLVLLGKKEGEST